MKIKTLALAGLAALTLNCTPTPKYIKNTFEYNFMFREKDFIHVKQFLDCYQKKIKGELAEENMTKFRENVTAFQKRHGLDPTTIVDRPTLYKMIELCDEAEKPCAGESCKELKALRSKIYY